MDPATDRSRWLVARFLPCALFALKASSATSSVGKTLLVPTPYAIKMALVDAGFAAGLSYSACDELLRALVHIAVRIGPPRQAVVSHTFLKIRQEPKVPDPNHPYISSVAYREFAFHRGEWRWAFDLADPPAEVQARIERLLPHIRYIGKRGSFIQFLGTEWRDELDETFTQPLDGDNQDDVSVYLPTSSHIVQLDDLGPDADLDTLSSYSSKPAKAGRHRIFVNTVVPLGVSNAGPGFTEYGMD